MADNPNVGRGPVEPEPNHVREKTYKAPNPPGRVEEEVQKLPEKTAEAKVEREMGDAVDEVKKRL
jgi:hypothetical protein